MKKQKANVCTGCSRHCTAENVRCKHGRAYFAIAAQAKAPEGGMQKPARKWERGLTPGGSLWQLLTLSRRMKKALRGGEIKEQKVISVLTQAEQQQLLQLIGKLDGALGEG